MAQEGPSAQSEAHCGSEDLWQQPSSPHPLHHTPPGTPISGRRFSRQIPGLLPAPQPPSALLPLPFTQPEPPKQQLTTKSLQLRDGGAPPERWTVANRSVKEQTRLQENKFLNTLNYGAVVFVLTLPIRLNEKGNYTNCTILALRVAD